MSPKPPGLSTPIGPRVADEQVDRVLREHARLIGQLAALPITALRIVPDVQLADGVETPVAHGMGRAPRWVMPSCARGGSTAGEVLEVRSGSVDRREYVVLKAIGYGATITVDLLVL
jgi:hypothetical protein